MISFESFTCLLATCRTSGAPQQQEYSIFYVEFFLSNCRLCERGRVVHALVSEGTLQGEPSTRLHRGNSTRTGHTPQGNYLYQY